MLRKSVEPYLQTGGQCNLRRAIFKGPVILHIQLATVLFRPRGNFAHPLALIDRFFMKQVAPHANAIDAVTILAQTELAAGLLIQQNRPVL